ncbi:unnamed protein product, partial [Darwinula stevensoni]
MCLEWIAESATPQEGLAGERVLGKRVLDYGCGSGILAIAAAKFDASSVDAVDIDPAAVEATLYNANKNAVQLQT